MAPGALELRCVAAPYRMQVQPVLAGRQALNRNAQIGTAGTMLDLDRTGRGAGRVDQRDGRSTGDRAKLV